VRYRLMASYQGSPFEADLGPTESDIVLFAACPPPEELGFEPATGHWRKQLRRQDVQAVWESRPVGIFQGERCMVLDDLGDRLHIGYLGHDGYQAERLGYWQVDRGVYELVAARSEVTDIVEQRTEYPRRPESVQQAPRAGQQSGGYPIPGTPQDQALYLPSALPQDQASYLPAGGGYVSAAPPEAEYQPGAEYQPRAGYQTDGSGGYGWPDGEYPADPADSLAGLGRYQPVPDEISGVALPPPAEAPLPLEAEALRAATASRRRRQPSAQRRPAPPPATSSEPVIPVSPAPAASPAMPAASPAMPAASPAMPPSPAASPAMPPAPATPVSHPQPEQPVTRRHAPAAGAPSRRSARRRLATERVFAELATLAAIPVDSYAVGDEVEGAMCLLQTDNGFEVFHSSNGNRHELQTFATEEAACFYLFGVLAAEAVRNGTLRPVGEPLMTSTGPLPIVRVAR
jgi:hypothetical protein